MSLRPGVKHGIGRLTASLDQSSTTRLTQVAHKSPTRWVPLGRSSVEEAGAAVCALSNYGGGMLQGDLSALTVRVEEGATLGVTTQGASRIYTQRMQNHPCRATLEATVAREGLLVWAPDPCALFRDSSFQQVQDFRIHPSSSVALIDWFSSGRFRNGEHWEFDRLSSRTSIYFQSDRETDATTKATIPLLQDAVNLDLRNAASQDENYDPLGVAGFHAFASLILYGTKVERVQRQCQKLQDALTEQHTRIRQRPQDDPLTLIELQHLGLAGPVVMGSSAVEIPDTNDDQHGQCAATVVRLAATTNEDLYRIFHHCLLPLAPHYGMEFYQERIRAKASEIPRVNGATVSMQLPRDERAPASSTTRGPDITESDKNPAMPDEDSKILWSAYMLADSALPTGSFAHSSGLEVAAQFGWLETEGQVQTFVEAATRSTLQVTVPFVLQAHRLVRGRSKQPEPSSVRPLLEDCKLLDRQCQAVLAPNAPACAASLDQGKSLARVAKQWLTSRKDPVTEHSELLECLESGGSHMGPVLGAVGAQLGLSENQVGRLLGYCVARDIVSAAVRLSLVGPLASVGLLSRVQEAVEEGWTIALECMEDNGGDVLASSAASAPVLEALHPCHDLLQVRLFRT